MKASELFENIKSDMQKLSAYRPVIEQKLLAESKNSTAIGYIMTKYNYDSFTTILDSGDVSLNFEADDDKLADFRRRMDNYLDLYAPEDPDLRQYIKGISTYLTFIARRPLHPPGIEFSNGAKVSEKDGSFYCSGKAVFIKDDLSLCKYCICKPADL